MRPLSAFFIFLVGLNPAFSQELTSSVYECRFINNLITTQSLRMKDYFDTQSGQRVGKVDLLEDSQPLESTRTLVYQIPLIDHQLLIQIWHAPDLRVDAQMSLSGKNKTFPAVYHKGPLQEDLFCTNLGN